MWYYDREELVALNSLQRALTEWYFRFSDLPLIGPFASMGFCMLLMMSLIYLSMVNRRRKTLMVMIPALITGIAGPFLPLVYLRYLLPMVGTVPCGWQPIPPRGLTGARRRPYNEGGGNNPAF